MKKADALIIGFGKGGKTLAGALAAAGKTVIMVEKSDKMYGGTCINVACIPTKSLVHSAALSNAFGGSLEARWTHYTEAIEEKNRLTSMLRNKNYHKLADHPNITVITGTAAFEDEHHVSVETQDDREIIEADQIFINTGARPFIPPIPGLKESRFSYLSETLLDQDMLPDHLVIIGGGYIGMEFASMYTNFGSHVTVIQDGPIFLPREDEEIAETVLQNLKDRGVNILLQAKTKQVTDQERNAILTVETQEGVQQITADAILIATGRRPNIEELHPEKAGILLTERGAIATDEHLCTNIPHIWAMGDVVGGLQFTYISLDDYRIVKSAILGDGSRTTQNRGAVPYSVFLDPPFSRAGLTEKEALDKGYHVKVAKLPAAAIPKAQVLQNPAGLLKAVIDADTDEILGAHLFCEESYEMINTIKVAMDAKLPYTYLRDTIYTHPTMTEAFNDLFASV